MLHAYNVCITLGTEVLYTKSRAMLSYALVTYNVSTCADYKGTILATTLCNKISY